VGSYEIGVWVLDGSGDAWLYNTDTDSGIGSNLPTLTFALQRFSTPPRTLASGSLSVAMALRLVAVLPLYPEDTRRAYMESRIFQGSVTVQSTDGSRSESFNAGERVKNVQRIGRGVMFEPVSAQRVAGTYAMEWRAFEANTTAVREAEA
jgi:hypothetical protein